jgi:hypothetical protein
MRLRITRQLQFLNAQLYTLFTMHWLFNNISKIGTWFHNICTTITKKITSTREETYYPSHCSNVSDLWFQACPWLTPTPGCPWPRPTIGLLLGHPLVTCYLLHQSLPVLRHKFIPFKYLLGKEFKKSITLSVPHLRIRMGKKQKHISTLCMFSVHAFLSLCFCFAVLCLFSLFCVL